MNSFRLGIVLALICMALFFAGCKTEQMKSTPFYQGDDITYTGKQEDRLNLWPVAYWREPVGSVLWPIVSFTDEHFAFRPIYSRFKEEYNFLWPLGRYDSATGDARFFPVFDYDAKNGDVKTVLVGRDTCCNHINWWWLTPFIGHKSGDISGFYFHPMAMWQCDLKMEEMDQLMNAEVLDGSITGKTKSEFDRRINVTNEVFRTESRSAYESLELLLTVSPIYKYSRYINCHGGDNGKIYGQSDRDEVKKAAGTDWREGDARTVAFTEQYRYGDRLFFGTETTRVVNFDYDSKAKVFDGEVSNTYSLFGMLWSSRKERITDARDYSKRAFVWYLWRREELNGDVSVDVFPGFTYDSKKVGSTNVSFLWRFFRYKNDPDNGTAVDVFFLPIWR